MSRRRGFFAEIQHQRAVAERDRQRARAAAVREQARLQHEAERAYAAAQRARAHAVRADARAQAEAEKEAKRLYIAAQESKAESLNSALELQLAEIDNILSATLEVDDYVDLEKLRRRAEHPPFSSIHQTPIAPPAPIQIGLEPVFLPPGPTKGMSSLFGKKKHAESIARARADFDIRHNAWQQAMAAVPMRQLSQLNEHRMAEDARQVRLAEDMARYEAECRARQEQVDAHNTKLDTLIRDFNEGKAHAVEEYIAIIFGNSMYPDNFPWPPECTYESNAGELTVQLQFPSPSQIPTVSQYRYVKAKDEIAEKSQTQKEQRDRYSNLLANMSLRTLHEVWESDRGGKIKTISLTGYVAHIDPATGKETLTPLLAVATDRDTFLDLDLTRITSPTETLKY